MAASKYNVAVVGIGIVGKELLRILEQRNFPIKSLKVLARSAREEKIGGRTIRVEQATVDAFAGVELALFAGSDEAESHVGWDAVRAHRTLVIDNGSAYRLYPNVPLVVPEVNGDALENHEGLIANPNCSTIQMVVPLKPLHDRARIKRVVVCTYQAVSGHGGAHLNQLDAEVQAVGKGDPVPAPGGGFKETIAGNVLSLDWGMEKDGYTKEEVKMVNETRKILGDDTIQVSVTCARVPVRYTHSEAVNVEFHEPLSAEEATRILAGPEWSPYLEVWQDECPSPLRLTGTDKVYVGRIRPDRSVPHGLNMWVVADNIRKGAALNAVQIAEAMVARGLVEKWLAGEL
jgi:aspartate-semialdehyde dehydrogenase